MAQATFSSINPATEATLQTYQVLSLPSAFRLIDKADEAFSSWKNLSFEKRSSFFHHIAHSLEQQQEPLARLAAQEMGKPLREGKAEISKCAWVCRYYADHAASFLQDEPVQTEAITSFITYQPQGVLLAIMPWNFPFWQIFRFIAPSLMAGNVVLLKPSPETMGCSLAIANLLTQAMLPQGVFSLALLAHETIPSIIEHPKIKGVTLTGSETAGKKVAASAGKALKKVVLELGGSDPYLVLEDADLDLAAAACVNGRMINNGQSCIAAKRFIVHEAVSDYFEKKVVALMKAKKVGNPLEETTEVGPLARFDLRENLHRQVCESISQGARLVLGGNLPQTPGYYYPPTVVTHITSGMPLYHEEVFGPVACLLTANSEEEAIRLANDTNFGLGAAVFTQDLERGKAIACHHIHSGICFINHFVHSDPRLPFGGINTSGFGRELGAQGIREFVNIKSISLY